MAFFMEDRIGGSRQELNQDTDELLKTDRTRYLGIGSKLSSAYLFRKQEEYVKLPVTTSSCNLLDT